MPFRTPTLSSSHQSFGLSLIVIVIVVTFLWAPFGLKKTIGLFEEWIPLNFPTQPLHLAYTVEPTRPFAFAPFILAQSLTPSSLVGQNLLMMFIFVGKGVMVYKILRRLVPKTQLFPFLAAMLYVIYPADTGLMTFRAMNIHFAILLSLIELDLLLLEWQHPQRWHWALIWPLHVVALLTYEIIFVVIYAAPVLLVWMQKGLSRRVVRMAAVWLSVPTILALRTAYYIGIGDAHYVTTTVDSGTQSDLTAKLVTQSLTTLYRRHVVAWFEAFDQTRLHSPYLIYALISGLVVGVLVWQHWSTDHRHHTPLGWRPALGMIIGGLMLMTISFAPYLLTPYRLTTFRVFYLSSLGAAIVLAAGLGLGLNLLRRWGQVPAAAIAGFLVVLASMNVFNQQVFLVNASASVERLLGGIIEQAPYIPRDNTVIVFVDERLNYQDEWHMASSGGALKGALRFLYFRPRQEVYMCVVKIDRPFKICTFEPDRLVYVDEQGKIRRVRYNNMLLFRQDYNGRIELLDHVPEEYMEPIPPEMTARVVPSDTYNPQALIDTDAPPPLRVYSTLRCWPIGQCLPPPPITPQSHIRLGFDQKLPGMGWELPYGNPSVLWSTAQKSTLYFNLTPDQAYTIRIHIEFWLADDVLQSLTLRVNEVDIPLQLSPSPETGVFFDGQIPREVIDANPDITRLLFSINRTIVPQSLGTSTDTRELGLLYDWLEINPVE